MSVRIAVQICSILFVALTAYPSAYGLADAPPPTTTVIASGTGKDEDAALKQALRNAVQQAVGLIVDAETVVKNDDIIKDQILTASNAIVSKYDPVGKPKTEDGLVTVTVKAVVENRKLTERLAQANVMSKAVEGKDLFAKVVTEMDKEKDAAKIIQRVFEGFPGNVLKAEPVGEPKLLSKTEANANVGVTVKFSIDMDKYDHWQNAFLPVLAKLATKTETVRWNPQTDGKSLDVFRFAHGAEVSEAEVKAGYNIQQALPWKASPGQFPLVVFER